MGSKNHRKQLEHLLLIDRTTRKPLVWASERQAFRGRGFQATDELSTLKFTGIYQDVIKPLALKIEEGSAQAAEAINLDGIQHVIDLELTGMDFLSWTEFLETRWLDKRALEGGFLITPYHQATGQTIPILQRAGILDLKLQAIMREVTSPNAFFTWAQIAYQTSYAYLLAGDDLFLLRDELLKTFDAYYAAKFFLAPLPQFREEIARIISYNIVQMDDSTFSVPPSEPTDQAIQLDLFGQIAEQQAPSAAMKTRIKDWNYNRLLTVESALAADRQPFFDYVLG
ncbi:hypothetical protein ACVR05_04135 [Streptococcus caprae]|uniref:Uncharacterized protein n=1 Tax=Streptococcus caprae TaxID=1640501 RepID=A0ABV8CYF8_9STRE